MKIISENRKNGKSIKMVKDCAESGATIVCSHAKESFYLNLAAEIGLEIHKPISYAEFIGGNYRKRGVASVYIDNASSLLNYMTKVPIEAITINAELIED